MSASTALQRAELNVDAAIKKLTSLVTTVVQRLDHIEEQLSQSMTLSSDGSKKQLMKSKDSVPLIIRVSCVNYICLGSLSGYTTLHTHT